MSSDNALVIITSNSNIPMYLLRLPVKKSCLLLLFCVEIVCGCSNEKVKTSPSDGAVEVVVKFLKNRYLNDPDSYKSREWGELIKNSDGTFQVTHRFSAKNVFGGVVTETLVFCISLDGQEVHICTEEDEKRILKAEREEQRRKTYDAYITKDFSNVLFHGVLTQTIDGIAEEYTFNGQLNKVGSKIEGRVMSIEKEMEYELSSNIRDEGKIDGYLKDPSNNIVIRFTGFISAKKLSAFSEDQTISFILNQSE